MGGKILNVPISSISDLKRSPMDIFKKADKENSGVYILNRNEVAGVMLTQKQYELLNRELDSLQDKIAELSAEKRILDKNVEIYSDFEVRGDVTNKEPLIDELDGWE